MTRCTHGFLHRLKVACKGQRVGILERFHDLGFRIERMARETAFVVQYAEMDRMGEACHLSFMRNRTRGQPMNPFPLIGLGIDTVTLHTQPGGLGVRYVCEDRRG